MQTASLLAASSQCMQHKIKWRHYKHDKSSQSSTTTPQSPLLYNGKSQIHLKSSKLPLPLRRSPSRHLIHTSLDRFHSPPQAESGSNQPFCHNTLSGQTDTQTNRWDRRQLYPRALTLYYIDRERRAKKNCRRWYSEE